MSILYENETIVIGLTMKYADKAAHIATPYLTHDKFIYSNRGIFGGREHQRIWQAIVMLVSQNMLPYPSEVVRYMNDIELEPYVRSLVDRLDSYYGISDFDFPSYQERCVLVDKTGVAYTELLREYKDSQVVSEQEMFEKFVTTKMPSAEEWMADRINQMTSKLKINNAGYQHMSLIGEQAQARWHALETGEASLLIETGIAPVMGTNIPMVECYSVIHGLSSSGKSALVHQIDLGIAITLFARKMKGCVAINSLEMNPIALMERFASLLSGYDTRRMRHGPAEMNGEDWKRFKAWGEVIARLPIYIDNTNLLTTSVMEYRASALHAGDTGPIWRMSSDYMEQFGDSDEENSAQNLRNVTYRHHGISRTLGASVTAISQTTPGADGKYNSSRLGGPMATRGSKAIYHSADVLGEVWNPIYMRDTGIEFTVPDGMSDDAMYLVIQKDRRSGILGPVKIGWQKQYTRAYDFDGSFGKEQKTFFTHMPELMAHFDEIRETLEVTKSQVVDPIDTTLGF